MQHGRCCADGARAAKAESRMEAAAKAEAVIEAECFEARGERAKEAEHLAAEAQAKEKEAKAAQLQAEKEKEDEKEKKKNELLFAAWESTKLEKWDNVIAKCNMVLAIDSSSTPAYNLKANAFVGKHNDVVNKLGRKNREKAEKYKNNACICWR